MRRYIILLSGLLLFNIASISNAHAYDWDIPVSIIEEEQYRNQNIREKRLREWQTAQQNNGKNISNNQLYNNQQIRQEPEADDLFAAAINGNTDQIGKLLSQGLDINTPNHERETALHMAAARGHYSTVIYLVNHGAYINAPTIKKWLPLHHAVRFRHPNIVNFLIKRGALPGARTSDGLSAIDMAKNINDYRMMSILGAR